MGSVAKIESLQDYGFSMIDKLQILKLLGRLGVWSIPIVCVTSFVPIILSSLTPSEPPLTESQTSSVLPSLSQLSSPLVQEDKGQVNDTSAVSPSTSLQTPKSKTTSSPTPQQSSVKAKHQTTPSPNKTSKAAQKPSGARHRSHNPLLPQLPQYKAPPIEIKVAVLTDVASAAVGTSTSASILGVNNKRLRTLPANEGFSVSANGSSLNLGPWQLPPVVWLQPTNGGLVFIGDRWYRGRMLLISQGNTLLAINYVDLEHYLYSVVGSEMHANAPTEALKAQAIAARSYALVHIIRPASQWYHLGATPRWQAYNGVESEYNTTQRAVSETSGQILSLRGGVVESLYAVTDDLVIN
ncbi:MAG: SpoIID/LytB domain-containing protein, partial [Microcystaceae cyanobacterium]